MVREVLNDKIAAVTDYRQELIKLQIETARNGEARQQAEHTEQLSQFNMQKEMIAAEKQLAEKEHNLKMELMETKYNLEAELLHIKIQNEKLKQQLLQQNLQQNNICL